MRKVIKPAKREVVEIRCDNCSDVISSVFGDDMAMPIEVSFPFGHRNDSDQGDSEFCSDTCVIQFIEKSIIEHGEYNVSETKLIEKEKLKKKKK